jgi:hypothetical protein
MFHETLLQPLTITPNLYLYLMVTLHFTVHQYETTWGDKPWLADCVGKKALETLLAVVGLYLV